MWSHVFTSIVLTGTLLLSEAVVESSINPADAREYYTRKRVNGVWITGHFERKSSVASPPVAAAADPSPGSGSTSVAADEKIPPLIQREFEARRPVFLAEFADPKPPEPGLLPLKRALEVRAKIMATPAADSGSQARAIRSMTLDFESRTRIIQFVDGSRTEEPFDPSATGGLNAAAMR
jgi:hypothetical protein